MNSSFPLCAVTVVAVLLGGATLSGCGDDQTGGSARSTSASAATGAPSESPSETVAPAVLPDNYRYVITSSCGERSFIGDYRVEVRNSQVVTARSLDERYPYQPDTREVPTLADLRDKAEAADPDTVVAYDLDDNGYPEHLSLDPVPNGIDDEECYTVTDLAVLGS